MLVAMKNAAEDVARTARKNHRFNTKTGTAENSIKSEALTYEHGIVYIDANVKASGEATNHAIYQHEGTGPAAGHGTITIKPKTKKALWWKGLEHPVKESHPRGIRPDKFIYRALDTRRKEIIGILSAGIERALTKAGLS